MIPCILKSLPLWEVVKLIHSRQNASLTEKFQQAKVTIFGLGGLGSNIGTMLARAGIGTLYLIDYDKVEASNLNRQNYYLENIGMSKTSALSKQIQHINPKIKTKSYSEKITSENIHKFLNLSTIFVEALDKASEKAKLFDLFLEHKDKYLVSANGISGLEPKLKVKKLNNIYLIGDFKSSESEGLYSPKVNLVAAYQALIVLNLIKECC